MKVITLMFINLSVKDLNEFKLYPITEIYSDITIARVKHVKDRKRLIEYVKEIKTKNIKFKVDRFFLKKSTLQAEGPVYEELEEYKLVD